MYLTGRLITATIFVWLFSLSPVASAQSSVLDQLRHDLAMRYLEPTPHMALAKFYFDKGDRLQAFYILESARRGRFEDTIFNQAFLTTFGHSTDSDNDREAPGLDDYRRRIAELYEKQPARAKAVMKEAIAKYPTTGLFRFNLGALLQREGKLPEAEAQLVKAAELSPRSSYIQAWVGRFFFKVRSDNQRALTYYLNAYFLDPHTYESEFVESRIRKINGAAAAVHIERLLKSGTPLIEIARDPNPTIAVQSVMQATEEWRPEYLATMVALMGHDDEEVRWLAAEAIKVHVDRSFDEQLRALLQEKDLRKRGLAAYVAVHLWKQESFETMRNMLREEAQLLRYDALSALIIEGGFEGRRIVVEHRARENNPTLQKLIDSTGVKKGLTNREP
jgi:tetratricopeptide (TPR) repeat protein